MQKNCAKNTNTKITNPIKHIIQNKAVFNDFKPDLKIVSPGRINLIGEHTDYNNGFVLPTAIDKNIYFYFKKNGSPTKCNIKSKSYDVVLELDLDAVKPSETEWENYVLGVIHELKKITTKIEGFDCLIDSDLPIGAGISSSASLECGMAVGLNSLFNLGQSLETLIKLSRAAEHNYVGTKCGIMDQFAVVMSKKDHVILLDCESLDYELIPIDISPYQFLLLNTNVSHNLASSEYNNRRMECEEGLKIIQKKHPDINSLRHVTLEILEEFRANMDSVIYNRCHYVINENSRVIAAAEHLKAGDLEAFGTLMYQSHDGLENDYEVSCDELDFLVKYSKSNEHILGSRMMGGGFGGCTINLIHKNAVAPYVKEVSEAYKATFGIDLTPIVVNPSGGTSALLN